MTATYDPYPRRPARYSVAAHAPVLPHGRVPVAQETAWEPGPSGIRLDGLAVAAVVIIAFLVVQFVLDRTKNASPAVPGSEIGRQTSERARAEEKSRLSPDQASRAESQESPPAPAPELDPRAIIYPYDEYWVTQGPHGQSYGHLAIDLAAGKGSPIKSPIHGQVTGNYVDQYGNTTLIIENEAYRVLMLHGDYTAQVGDQVRLGDVVGSESNHGYTLDQYGNLCAGRDCGYHTHLNVYDKQAGANVNPLDVLP